MSDAKQQNDAPPAVPALPVQMLSYAPLRIARVSPVLLGTLVVVAVADLLVGGTFLLTAGHDLLNSPNRSKWAVVVAVSMLFILPAVTVLIRNEWFWRRSYQLLVASGLLCTALCLLIVRGLWLRRNGLSDDPIMLLLSISGLYGALNLAAAYVLCRAKRGYQAGHIDTVVHERIRFLIPVPLATLVIGFVIFMKYYA